MFIFLGRISGSSTLGFGISCTGGAGGGVGRLLRRSSIGPLFVDVRLRRLLRLSKGLGSYSVREKDYAHVH